MKRTDDPERKSSTFNGASRGQKSEVRRQMTDGREQKKNGKIYSLLSLRAKGEVISNTRLPRSPRSLAMTVSG